MEDWKTRRYQIKTYIDICRMLKRRSICGPIQKKKPSFKFGLEKARRDKIQKKIPVRSYKWTGKAFLKTIPKGGFK